MPKYDYSCSSCGNKFSKVLKIADRKGPEESPCEQCGEQNVKQVIGTPLVCYSQPGVLRTSDNFNDRLKDVAKNRGNGCTVNDSIR